MKRPALQNKRVGVLGTAFLACKVFGSFEKRTPGDRGVYQKLVEEITWEKRKKQKKTKRNFNEN